MKSCRTSRTNTKHETTNVQVDLKEQVTKVKDMFLTRSAQYMPVKYPLSQNTGTMREIELGALFNSTFGSEAGSTLKAMTQVQTYIDMMNTSLQRVLHLCLFCSTSARVGTLITGTTTRDIAA